MLSCAKSFLPETLRIQQAQKVYLDAFRCFFEHSFYRHLVCNHPRDSFPVNHQLNNWFYLSLSVCLFCKFMLQIKTLFFKDIPARPGLDAFIIFLHKKSIHDAPVKSRISPDDPNFRLDFFFLYPILIYSTVSFCMDRHWPSCCLKKYQKRLLAV